MEGVYRSHQNESGVQVTVSVPQHVEMHVGSAHSHNEREVAQFGHIYTGSLHFSKGSQF